MKLKTMAILLTLTAALARCDYNSSSFDNSSSSSSSDVSSSSGNSSSSSSSSSGNSSITSNSGSSSEYHEDYYLRYLEPSAGYDHLPEVINDIYNGVSKSYKTWGQVTAVYTNATGQYHYFNMTGVNGTGDVAGIQVFTNPSNIQVGDFVTVSGTAAIYNNLVQMAKPQITLDSRERPMGATPVSNDFFNDYSSEQLKYFGLFYIELSDVVISYDYGLMSTGFFGSQFLVFHYANSNSESEIDAFLRENDGETLTIRGYLFIMAGIETINILLISVDDLTGEGSGGGETNLPKITTLNGNNFNVTKTHYDTGNYGSNFVDNVSYEYYRIVKTFDSTLNSNTIMLLPYFSYLHEHEIGGAITNTSAMRNIKSIEITYRTNLMVGAKPRLYVSKTQRFTNYAELELSLTSLRVSFEVSDANYFRIESSNSQLFIKEIIVHYDNNGEYPTTSFLSSASNKWRKNPIVFQGSLYEGATINVPIAYTQSGSSYVVSKTKSYTYYSFDYVYENRNSLGDVSSFTYTTPLDLAVFYTAFGTYPANYDIKDKYYSVQEVFGEDARQVSTYSRTDGYALAVPWKAAPGSSEPFYQELDIALDETYGYWTRGVGRLVCWRDGFDTSKFYAFSGQSATGLTYDTSPVCVYTDDHYTTFMEYYNNGTFSHKLNAEGSRTNYVWGLATTL